MSSLSREDAWAWYLAGRRSGAMNPSAGENEIRGDFAVAWKVEAALEKCAADGGMPVAELLGLTKHGRQGP